jgi:hypothetical protein
MNPARPLAMTRPLLPVIGTSAAALPRRRLMLLWRRARRERVAAGPMPRPIVVNRFDAPVVTINASAPVTITGAAPWRPGAALPPATRALRLPRLRAMTAWRAGPAAAAAATQKTRALWRPAFALAVLRHWPSLPVATMLAPTWPVVSHSVTAGTQPMVAIALPAPSRRAWWARPTEPAVAASAPLVPLRRFSAVVAPLSLVRTVEPLVAPAAPQRGPSPAPAALVVPRPSAPRTDAAVLSRRRSAPVALDLARRWSSPLASTATRVPLRRPTLARVWRAPHPEAPAPTLAVPSGDDGARGAARAAAVAAWAAPSSAAAPAALPDTGRVVDEVMRRLDQRQRNERQRRGI